MVHYSGPPTVGGVQNVMAAHGKAFADAGYSVKMVVGRGGDFYPGVEVEVIPAMDPKHESVAGGLKSLEGGEPWEALEELKTRMVDELRQALSSCHVCIVHNIFTMDKNIILTAALCELAGMLEGVGFVAWTHDAVFLREEFNDGRRPDTRPWSRLSRPVPGVRYAAVSSARAGEIASRWRGEEVDLLSIPNGISPADLLGINSDDYRVLEELGVLECFPVILMPVRVLERKNIGLALRVVRTLADMGKEPRLVVTGPPGTHSPGHVGYFQFLKTEVEELGIVDYVKFLYEFKDLSVPSLPLQVTDGMVAALYNISDILFMPSTEEGFGIPLLEAGVFKLPVLCSDIGPFREIGGEKVEFFASGLAPEKMAQKVLSLTEGTKTGRMFRSAVKEFRWENIFQEKIEPLILEIWEEKRGLNG